MGSAGKGAAGMGSAAMHSSSTSRTSAHADRLLPSPPMPASPTTLFPIPPARACPDAMPSAARQRRA
eukprot:11518556-Prorocentrum_lima.AAC.1